MIPRHRDLACLVAGAILEVAAADPGRTGKRHIITIRPSRCSRVTLRRGKRVLAV
jgi:hypothetical protein